MSRLKHAEPILHAAEQWKHRCLLAGGSILSDRQLWNLGNVEELHRSCVENKAQSEHGFIATLKLRLDPESPAIKHLCAELLWFYYLFPSNMTVETKRDRVETCWSWSGEPLQERPNVLTETILGGAGSAGAAYFTYMWLEFRFFVLSLIHI